MVATISGARTAISSQVVSGGKARLGRLGSAIVVRFIGFSFRCCLRAGGRDRDGRGRWATGISDGASPWADPQTCSKKRRSTFSL